MHRITEPYLQQLGFKCNTQKNYYHKFFKKGDLTAIYDPIDDIWEIRYKDTLSPQLLLCKTKFKELAGPFISFCENFINIQNDEPLRDL